MIRAYLREKKRRILLDAVFVLVFVVCFILNGVALTMVWYPTFLCLLFWMMYVAWDFQNFRKKHKHLLEVANHIDETRENLPLPANQLEEDYQELILTVVEADQKKQQAIQNKLDGNREYITLWAHQIKTPITAMGLMLQELEEENLPEKRRELTAKLFEVEQYVDTTLQYLRLDTMTHDLVLKEYRLFDIVKQAVRYFSKTFIAKRLSLNLVEEDVIVVTDEKWLVFVLKQILSNALKYTKTGSISIYMHPEKKKVLVIEDTGIGISPEDLPRICERGFTGYNGRMQKKATGIGLYLSKMILDKLEHGIEISSVEGQGTKVEIRL